MAGELVEDEVEDKLELVGAGGVSGAGVVVAMASQGGVGIDVDLAGEAGATLVLGGCLGVAAREVAEADDVVDDHVESQVCHVC